MQQEKETAQESCGKLTDHRDTLWCRRQIYAVKGGKKSGLVTLRTAEREGQAGECIRHSTSPNIKLSPSYFAWIFITFSIFSSLPNLTLNILFLSIFPTFFSSQHPKWMGNGSMTSQKSEMANFKSDREGKQKDEAHRFLCTSVLWSCCGRGGGNCLYLCCQQCPGKALSVHKATQTRTKVWAQDSNSSSPPVTTPSYSCRKNRLATSCM